MHEKLLEQKEALEKQFADLSGNEGFHYKLENEILNSQFCYKWKRCRW
ncbi:hypothetical protein OLU56_04655 [Campylobacter jejuni]|nr:hypothetical protein [Campylobacter jejuni]HEF4251871.1 hypothetical protein [Campylobacter jejuni]